jgi:hypothetical protein
VIDLLLLNRYHRWHNESLYNSSGNVGRYSKLLLQLLENESKLPTLRQGTLELKSNNQAMLLERLLKHKYGYIPKVR